MNKYQPHEIKLANEIAETLKDRDSIDSFLIFTRKYKEDFLREKLAKVMAMDESKIRKSRGALFTHLVTQHGSNGNSRS
jgi:hypothetical protein